MNVPLILEIAKPFIKDNTITYDEFAQLYEFLSRREQYDVVEILHNNGINLVDAEESPNIDHCINHSSDLFMDKVPLADITEDVVVKDYVSQSNEILCGLIQGGNKQAKQDLCVKNKNLIFDIAKKYKKFFNQDLDFDDLCQAGMIGLITAAEKFDVRRGYKFTTYATWWIRQSICREITDTGFTIRIPAHAMDKIIKISKAEKNYMIFSFGERVQKLSETLSLSKDEIIRLLDLKNYYLNLASLDAPANDESDTKLADLIPSIVPSTTEDLAIQADLKFHLMKVLSTLRPIEQKVLRLRFGLDDGIEKTLETIGGKFGVTRERIRQIESKALTKLRIPSKLNKLRAFLY